MIVVLNSTIIVVHTALYSINLYIYILVCGFNPSEKYDFVSWEYEIPNIWKQQNQVPNHQPDHSSWKLTNIIMENHHHFPIVDGL